MADYTSKCKDEMSKRIAAFDKDLARVRTGRASISMVDGVKVDYYGTLSPINQVATLSTPDARTILISPFEKKLIQEIEKSIMKAADVKLRNKQARTGRAVGKLSMTLSANMPRSMFWRVSRLSGRLPAVRNCDQGVGAGPGDFPARL